MASIHARKNTKLRDFGRKYTKMLTSDMKMQPAASSTRRKAMNFQRKLALVGMVALAPGWHVYAQSLLPAMDIGGNVAGAGPAEVRPTQSCLKKAGYRDGCPTASAEIPAFPALLDRYKVRPPWNVAGVDYAVGIPSRLSLKDPRRVALPAGCSLQGTTVTCSGTVVLDGYDFSPNNGTTLIINGGNVTVQNCRFAVGSNQGALGEIVDVRGLANATFLNNEFDGLDIPVTPQRGQTIGVLNTGTVIFRYNYFHNSGGDMLDFSAGPQVNIVQYNVFKDIGLKTAHSDTLQWCGSIISSADLGFNTVIQNLAGLSGMGLMVPNSECSGAKMSNVLVHNNTLISRVRDNFATGATVSQDAGPATADHVAVFDNYLDPTGIKNFTASPWFPTGFYRSTLPQPSALHSLIDMTTGSALPVANNRKQKSTSFYVCPDASGYCPALSDVYSVSAAPRKGKLSEGDSVTFVLEMDEPWEVAGQPTLSLNSGGTAHYTGRSANSLRFTYTIGKGQNALNLAITAVDLNGGVIKDEFGNRANLTGALTSFPDLSVR